MLYPQEADIDMDGMINYQEFCDIIVKSQNEEDDVTSNLVIEVPKV